MSEAEPETGCVWFNCNSDYFIHYIIRCSHRDGTSGMAASHLSLLALFVAHLLYRNMTYLSRNTGSVQFNYMVSAIASDAWCWLLSIYMCNNWSFMARRSASVAQHANIDDGLLWLTQILSSLRAAAGAIKPHSWRTIWRDGRGGVWRWIIGHKKNTRPLFIASICKLPRVRFILNI